MDVGMHFHQIHAVQGTLQEVHHRLQLEVGGGIGRQMVKQDGSDLNISGQRAQRSSTAGKKPRIPGSHRGLGSSLLIITGQGEDIIDAFYKYTYLCFLF